MKTILAVLTFALVAGQSLPDEVKSFFDRIVGQRAPAGLIVTATADFGSNPRPGDRVSWVVDVRNPGRAAVYQQMVVQTTTNLSALTAVLDCPPSGGCTNIGPQAFSGDAWAMPINEMLPGAHATITETATVPAAGPFSVVVRSAPQPLDPVDYAGLGNVVATLPGQTGQSTTTTDTSNSTDQGAGAQNGSNAAGPETESGQSIRVTRGVTPNGAYQVGEGVTANFTFWNDGATPQTITVLGNKLGGLQLSDYRLCGPRCSFVVPAGNSILWNVDGVIADNPGGRAPSSFSDTVYYRVGDGEEASATVSAKLGPSLLTWLALGGAVLVVATAATSLAVNNARRRWWRNHISAHADARAGEATVKPHPIPDHVVVRLEYGSAGSRGPIPIERISDG